MYFFHIYIHCRGFRRVAFSHLVTYFKSSVSCQHSQASVSWSMTCSLRWDVRRVCAGISPLKGSLTGVLVFSVCGSPAIWPHAPSSPTSKRSAPDSQPSSQVPSHLGFGKLLQGLISQQAFNSEDPTEGLFCTDTLSPRAKLQNQLFCRMF